MAGSNKKKVAFSCLEMLDRDTTTAAEKEVVQRKLNKLVAEAKDESDPLFVMNRVQILVDANTKLAEENKALRLIASGMPRPQMSVSQMLRSVAKNFTEEMNLRKLVILVTIPVNDVIKFSDIAAITGYHKSVCTRHLNNLVIDGMITREIDSTDGRGKVVALTPEGRAFVTSLETCVI